MCVCVGVCVCETHTHTHTHTYIYIYIYIYMCVCVCVCVCGEGVGVCVTHTHTYIYIYIYLYVCVREREREIEIKSTLPRWNPIGCGMTAPPPELSPRSILPPVSSHCAFLFPSKDLTRSKFVICFNFLLLFKNCLLHIFFCNCTAGSLMDWGYFFHSSGMQMSCYVSLLRTEALGLLCDLS